MSRVECARTWSRHFGRWAGLRHAVAALVSIVILTNSLPRCHATQPVRFNYQARIVDSNNVALNGTHSLTFKIFQGGTATTADSGTPIFTETVMVTLSNGVASVPLGNSVPMTDLMFAADADYFLQVAVDSPSNIVIPRSRLEAVPFAISSRAADRATTAVGIGWTIVTTNTLAVPNRSYAVNSQGVTTVTLPVSPSVGDTVRVSGLGPGRWTVAQNAGQSIFVEAITSVPLTWTPRDMNREWISVASSVSGTRLVAVGFGTPIMVSDDAGATWQSRELNRAWSSVACSADGTRIAACENVGKIYISDDCGVTWTPQATPMAWTGIASSADGMRLVACVASGQIYVSTDYGVTWDPRDSDRSWTSVASSADGMHLSACQSPGFIFTSSDGGTSWTARDSGRDWSDIASSADGSHLVACSFRAPYPGQIYTSTDFGVTWTPRESDRFWNSVASSADGTRLVAAAESDSIFTSTDGGVTWSPSETNRNWTGVASSADGTRLVACAKGDQLYTRGNWTSAGSSGRISGVRGSVIELQYAGDGVWIPISLLGPLAAY
jgi:hypothetical protein